MASLNSLKLSTDYSEPTDPEVPSDYSEPNDLEVPTDYSEPIDLEVPTDYSESTESELASDYSESAESELQTDYVEPEIESTIDDYDSESSTEDSETDVEGSAEEKSEDNLAKDSDEDDEEDKLIVGKLENLREEAKEKNPVKPLEPLLLGDNLIENISPQTINAMSLAMDAIKNKTLNAVKSTNTKYSGAIATTLKGESNFFNCQF